MKLIPVIKSIKIESRNVFIIIIKEKLSSFLIKEKNLLAIRRRTSKKMLPKINTSRLPENNNTPPKIIYRKKNHGAKTICETLVRNITFQIVCISGTL